MKVLNKQIMRALPLPVALLAAVVAFRAPADPPRIVASANGQIELSTARLADVIGNSTAAPDVDIARQIAMLWVNYQLLGLAGAAGDSLKTNEVVADAKWSDMAEIRYRKFRDSIERGWTSVTPAEAEESYAKGKLLAARQIIITVDSNATQAEWTEARLHADSLHKIVTARFFAPPVAVPDSLRPYDDLGVFRPGDMVEEFESVLDSLDFGAVSDAVRTSFGYHIIYRPKFVDVADEVTLELASQRLAESDSAWLARLDRDYNITIMPGAVERARVLAKAARVDMGDSDVLVTYKGGKLDAARFARWLEAFPPGSNVVGMASRGPDSLVLRVLRRVARSEVELGLADAAGIQVTAVEFEGLRHRLYQELYMDWTALGIGPDDLAGETTQAAREQLARRRVEDYFDRMVREEVPYISVPSALARALRARYTAQVNDDALSEAVVRAVHVRAAMDSVRSATAPVPGSRPEARPTPNGQRTPVQLRVPPTDTGKRQ